MKLTTKGHIQLTWENILSKISEYDIFRYYIISFNKPGKAFCSELRKDKKPSCSIKLLSDGRAIYKDFSTGEVYTPISYLKYKYNLSYLKTLIMISNDFNIGNYGKVEKTMGINAKIYQRQPKSIQISLRIVSKLFTKTGLEYWKKYGITEKILNKYEVKQISQYYLNGNTIRINKNEIAFSYHFGNYKYKILRPSSEYKWITNCDYKNVQGVRQLIKKGKTLLITKSLKDIMCLSSLGVYAVAPQSESTLISKNGIKYLKKRWERIFIYYDNDEPGIKLAKQHSKSYDIPFIHNPIGTSKDASDYYKDHGEDSLKKMLKIIINNGKYNIYTRECTFTKKQQNKDIKGSIPF